MLNIEKKIDGEKAEITAEGRLDTITAPELEGVIREIVPSVTELVLDFEKLDYISSAGLRVLLSTHKNMTGKGGLKIVNVSRPIMEIFEVTGFSEILTIE
ncbi:MAG: STAS domain-containing protein [Clostridia bacterium]|nr:STAS domain-containing protein [Clostridia bacterium]